MPLDNITDQNITDASAMDDLDTAIAHLAKLGGITEGDVAAQHFSGFDDANGDFIKSTPQQRANTLREWLETERFYEDDKEA